MGYELFSQVYRSGIKAGYLDFDQVRLCYPPPDDDPGDHRVKAQNLGAVWPRYRAAGARCLIAAGSAGTRETVRMYADLCVDTGDRSVRDVVRLIRARAGQWPQLPA